MSARSRALHFVLKVGSLEKNLEFFRGQLGMTVLRHEVFEQGCDAACNGPYDELTYNYSVGKYELGNDLQYIKLALNEDNYTKLNCEQEDDRSNTKTLFSPDGYNFLVTKLENNNKQDVIEVCLSCTKLDESKKYWCELLKMKKVDDSMNLGSELLLNYDEMRQQADLRLRCIQEKLDRKAAFGRIAFSCPSEDLKVIQKASEDAQQKVLTPYLSLDTPGKATVQVVILADPDGHEICFVGDEGFRALSQVDHNANELIEKSIAEDKSDEWYAQKNKPKKTN